MILRHKKNKFGFSLIEILVVISIIAVLSSVIIYNAAKAHSLSRDGQRAADLSRIGSALGLYFLDHGFYPATVSGATLVPRYMAALPVDPTSASNYVYAALDKNSSVASCESYHLGAVMENSGFSGLSQDSDVVSGTICTGSAADFNGNAASCSGASAASPDACFDIVP